MSDMPKFWTGLEQLGGNAPRPAVDPAVPVTDKPSGEISLSSRRDFLKLGGVAAVFSMLGCMRRPASEIIPYLNQPELLVPGVADFYATTCGECAAGCGVIARVREGRPVKLEGNPAHPVNRGKLCIRGQASLFNLYDPGRLAGAVRKKPDGTWESADFADLDTEIAGKLAGGSGEILLLTGTWSGPARNSLVEKFLAGFPGAEHIAYEPLTDHQWQECVAKAFGWDTPPLYCFDQAREIVFFGADPLAVGTQRMQYLRDFIAHRDPEGEWMSRVVCFEPGFSESGAMADIRYPVRAADLYKIAGALARVLLVDRKVSGYATDGRVTSYLTSFDPAAVERELGLAEGFIEKLAGRLAGAPGECVLVSENFSNQSLAGRKLHALVSLLNAALGSPGKTIMPDKLAATVPAAAPAEIAGAIDRMRSGRVAAVIVAGTNPAFTLPTAAGFTEALSKVPLKVSLADRIDETAGLCDYVLPSLHPAESWNDSELFAGTYALQQPLITPIWDNRQVEQSLISLAFAAGNREFAAGEAAIEWRTWLRQYWQEKVYPELNVAGDFDSFWIETLQQGLCTLPKQESASSTLARFRPEVLTVLNTPDKPAGGFELRLAAGSIHGDGRAMNNAWLLETPQPVTKVAWENYLSLAPDTAKEFGVTDGSIVKLTAGGAAVQVPVLVQPGIAAGAAVIDVGWGRRAAGEVGNGRGTDVFSLAGFAADGYEYTLGGAGIAPTGARIRLASVQHHTSTESRPIVFTTTLGEFAKNKEAGQFSHAGHEKIEPTLEEYRRRSIWGTDHAYPGHRWGMAVDLNKCTGCGACTVACMVENNIPVVGKKQILNGREMHWIRIDRYYSGDPENPKLVYQPMLCQQCMSAPCETVCPVVATVHNDEGLNLQIYNRCVGTRYCSNNCPYKVRRFNWHEYALEAYKSESMRMVLNPDVTVREKGVMEKCTFCIQRIREARYRAKERGVPIREGDIQPACVQTCPTGALVFGDLNDPESEVHKLYFKQRGFRALDELNVVPSIAYLTKVMNREAEAEVINHGEQHGERNG